MEHRLIQELEKVLGGPRTLGKQFARGSLADPALAELLLTPARMLDLIMRRSLSTPQLRAFQDGSELHPTRYYADVVTRRGQAVRMADMRKLGAILEAGATLVLDEVDVFDPSLEVFCRALQWWSHERVQVNAYLTTQNAAGFPLHWDDHEVIVLQVSGEKRWEVRGSSRTAPMYRDAEPNNEPSQEIVWSGTLKPGDVMHIPRGYWHQATRAELGGGHSLHLTFGVVKRTGVSWLEWLGDWCRQDSSFRLDLDRWGSQTDVAAQRSTLIDAAAQLIGSRSPADYLASRERETPSARHLPPAVTLFGAPAAVACITEFPPLIDIDGETAVVVAAGKRLTFAARALPALRLLLSGNPVDLAEARTETGIDAAALAEILIKEDLCVALTPESSSGYTALATAGTCSTAR